MHRKKENKTRKKHGKKIKEAEKWLRETGKGQKKTAEKRWSHQEINRTNNGDNNDGTMYVFLTDNVFDLIMQMVIPMVTTNDIPMSVFLTDFPHTLYF